MEKKKLLNHNLSKMLFLGLFLLMVFPVMAQENPKEAARTCRTLHAGS